VPTPQATPTPTPAGGAQTSPAPPVTPKLKLATKQKGARVRGTVTVEQPATRLEVTVKSGKTKVGSWRRTSTAKGTVAFSVALNAKARKTLKAKHRLKLAVTVALTPPGGRPQTVHATAVVSL
jgi:hypothetical protein